MERLINRQRIIIVRFVKGGITMQGDGSNDYDPQTIESENNFKKEMARERAKTPSSGLLATSKLATGTVIPEEARGY